MPSAYSVLGQQAPSAATLTTLYTCPGSTQAVVSSILVCNRSATPTMFRIAVRPAGGGISNEHYIAYDHEILGNEAFVWTVGLTLEATDVISVYNTLATVSFQAHGVEITP
jgi:hypothetical protein